jgi:hypothetical protein
LILLHGPKDKDNGIKLLLDALLTFACPSIQQFLWALAEGGGGGRESVWRPGYVYISPSKWFDVNLIRLPSELLLKKKKKIAARNFALPYSPHLIKATRLHRRESMLIQLYRGGGERHLKEQRRNSIKFLPPDLGQQLDFFFVLTQGRAGGTRTDIHRFEQMK